MQLGGFILQQPKVSSGEAPRSVHDREYHDAVPSRANVLNLPPAMSLFNPKTIKKSLEAYAFQPTLQQAARASAPGPRHAYRARLGRSRGHGYGDFAQVTLLKEILGYNTVLDGDDYTAAEHEPIANGSVEFALGQFSASKRQLIAPFELKGANLRSRFDYARALQDARLASVPERVQIMPTGNGYSSATMSS